MPVAKWVVAPVDHSGYISDPTPRLSRDGELVDFRQKGDNCTVFLRVPACFSLADVARVMRGFGALRVVSAFGSPGADGSWDALAGYWTAGEAWLAQRELKARGRELWASGGEGGGGGGPPPPFFSSPGGSGGAAMLSPPPLPGCGEARVHARLGIKRRAAADAAAVAAAAGGGGDFDHALSATQTAQMLNALLPLQWSNTLELVEVQAACRSRPAAPAAAAPRAGPPLPGGVPSAWDEGAQAYVPPPQATVVAKRLRRGGGCGEDAAAAAAALGGGEEGASQGEAAAAADVRDRFTLEEEDGDGDPNVPLPLPAQRLQAAKYADFCSRHAVPSASSLAEAFGEAVLARARPSSMMGGLGSLPVPQRRLAVAFAPPGAAPRAPLPGMPRAPPPAAPPPTARARPPCAYVRQVITVQNPGDTAVVASSGGGCACRHREEGAAGGAVVLLRAPGAARRLPPRAFHPRAGCALVAAPCGGGGAPAEELLPLSQQPPPPESAAPSSAHCRYALSGRKWTAEDVVDGIPVKWTVAEAFCRACEGVRVMVQHPLIRVM
jgi:hypothetical protein